MAWRSGLIGSSNSEYPLLLTSEQLGKNGVQVYIRDKWRNHPNKFFVVYYLTVLEYTKTTIQISVDS